MNVLNMKKDDLDKEKYKSLARIEISPGTTGLQYKDFNW